MKAVGLIAMILVVIGAINWGLIGLGMLIGSDLNVVKLILGSVPTVEAIVYLLVGVSGLLVGWVHVTGKCAMK